VWRSASARRPRSATCDSDIGIETVYQDLALCDNLDLIANLYLGRERRRDRSMLLDQEGMQANAAALIADLAPVVVPGPHDGLLTHPDEIAKAILESGLSQ
jgi:ABC-type sugar transport system ATPase subunit